MKKSILTFITLSLFFALSFGCSSQPQISTSLMQVNNDGTMTEVEKIAMPEGQLTADELVAKEHEIEILLEEQNNIEDAFVTLYYRKGEPEKVCFQVGLKGDALEEHIDEISALIKGELESCDLENSCIADVAGKIIYPVNMDADGWPEVPDGMDGLSEYSCHWGEFPGGIEPVLMVNGKLYQWNRLNALGLTVQDEDGVVVSGTYLPEGFQEVGEITSVTEETPTQNFQIQAGFSVTGTIYTNPETPLVVYACVNTDGLKDCYIRFVNEAYQPGLIRLDGKLYWFDAVGDGSVCASESLEELPEGCVSAGTIQGIVWDRYPEHELEVNDARDTYSKSLWGREVFRNPEDGQVIYLYEEQYWQEGSYPMWRACHLWEEESTE